MDEKEISEEMYAKCLTNDKKEFWTLITDSEWAFIYCTKIKNRSEVRKHITDSEWCYCYCINVEDRPDVRKNITDPTWLYFYNEKKKN